MREWFKANGGFLAIVIVGLGVMGWTNTTIGLVLVIVGFAGFLARALLPLLPWRIALIPKKKPPPRTSLPSVHLPLWLNPLTPRKHAANILLEEGYNLLASIPEKAPSALAAALVGVQAQREEKLPPNGKRES